MKKSLLAYTAILLFISAVPIHSMAQCTGHAYISSDLDEGFYLCTGSTVNLEAEIVNLDESQGISYQWYFNNTIISAGTTKVYSVTYGSAVFGEYRVEATSNSTACQATSSTITLKDGSNTYSGQTFTPDHYWTFDEASPEDDRNNPPVKLQCAGSPFPSVSGGLVGNYADLNYRTGNLNGRISIGASEIHHTGLKQLSVEYIFKPNENYNSGYFMQTLAGGYYGLSVNLNSKNIQVTYSYYNSQTQKRTTDTSLFHFARIGRRSWDHYNDGNWHHIAATFDLNSGKLKVYIDGVSTPYFQRQRIAHQDLNGANEFRRDPVYTSDLIIGAVGTTNNSGYSDFGKFDEFAIYENQILPPTLVYQHYLDATNSNTHYTYADGGIEYCSTIATLLNTIASASQVYDPREYPVGYDPNTPPADHTDIPSGVLEPVDQMVNAPFPRYYPGHTSQRNYPWFNYAWLAGLKNNTNNNKNYAPGPTDVINNAGALNKELASHWNYYTYIGGPHTPTQNFTNAHPEIPACYTTHWRLAYYYHLGLPNIAPRVGRPNMTPSHYVLDVNNKAVLAADGGVSLSPLPPLATIAMDGTVQGAKVLGLMEGLQRPINLINENGEVLPHSTEWINAGTYRGNGASGSNGTVVGNDYAQMTSWSNWTEYSSFANARLRTTYRDALLSYSPLLDRPETGFTYYSIDGMGGHLKMLWDQNKTVQKNFVSNKLSTPDYYPPGAKGWDEGIGARHGLGEWIEPARNNEIKVQDLSFSPYVSPGWSEDPRANIRPGQWLGLMKIMGMYGAEFYYTSHFYGDGAIQRPEHWAWQILMPSYAQALRGRAEHFWGPQSHIVRDADMMVPLTSVSDRSLRLVYGGGDTYTMARKYDPDITQTGDEEYLIMSTKQRRGNIMPVAGFVKQKPVTIEAIDGDQLNITITSREQGSVYIYKMDEQHQQDPVMIQLDGWHEAYHPDYWSQDFVFEAEVHDGLSQITTNVLDPSYISLRTETYGPVGDFTNFTTYYTFPNFDPGMHTVSDWGLTQDAPRLTYQFRVSNADDVTEDYGLKLRMRNSRNEGITGCYIQVFNEDRSEVLYSDYVGCVSSGDWMWYTEGLCGSLYLSGLETGYYLVDIIPENEMLDIDRVILDLDDDVQLPQHELFGSCGSWAPNTAPNYEVDFTWSTSCEGEIQFTSFVGPLGIGCSQSPMYKWTFVKGGQQSTTGWGTGTATWNNGTFANPTETFNAGVTPNEATLSVDFGGGVILHKGYSLNILSTPTCTIPASVNPNTGCSGNTIQLTATTAGGTAPYDYSWYPSLNALNAIQKGQPNTCTADVLLNEPGISQYKVTVTDANGCTATSLPFNVTTDPELNVTLVQNHIEVCENHSGAIGLEVASVENNAAPGAYSYDWSPATHINNAFIHNPTVTNMETQLFTVTVEDPNTGCIGKAHALLDVGSIRVHGTVPDICINESNDVPISITTYCGPTTALAAQCSTGIISGCTMNNCLTVKWTNYSKSNTSGYPEIKDDECINTEIEKPAGGFVAGSYTYRLLVTNTVTGTYTTTFVTLNVASSCPSPVPPMSAEQIVSDASGQISLYPNPSEGLFELNLSEDLAAEVFSIRIYDLSGKEVLTQQNASGATITVDAQNLSEGSYVIRLHNEQYNFKMRAIIR